MRKQLLFIGIMMLFTFSVMAQIPKIKWWYDLHDMSFGNAASADLDKDGKPEIVFSTYRNDSTLYCLNAEDGSLRWKFNTGGCNDVAPTIYDVNDDDTLDVILPSSCVAKTFCFNGFTGKKMWEAMSNGSDSPPTIGDLDNDGKMEILHGEFGGTVRCLNAENGSLNYVFDVDPNSWVQTEPVILDLNGDGQLDFFVANWSFGTNHAFFAYKGDDHSLLWEQHYPKDVMYHGASFGDLDHDGKPELAIGSYDGWLYVMNGEDGSLLLKDSLDVAYGYVGSPTSMGDIDGDGELEIVFTDYYKIAAISLTDSVEWTYTMPVFGQSFRGAALSDLDGDSLADVVFGTSEGDLIALKGTTGSELWTISLKDHMDSSVFEIDHGPIVDDFDGDDTLEVFVVGGHAEYPAIENNWGRAYAVSAGVGGPAWPMFRRDIVRSACLCGPASGSVSENQKQHGDLILWPNPGNGNFMIKASGKAGSEYELSIFDISGRRVLTEHFRSPDASFYHQVHAAFLSSGLYLVKLISGDRVQTARMCRQ